MKLRFQIGSNRPLAKRTRMFWRRLFAQEVVDAEDLLFVEDLVHRTVELDGAGEVRAERLFHHDARIRHQARLAQGPHCRERRWAARSGSAGAGCPVLMLASASAAVMGCRTAALADSGT